MKKLGREIKEEDLPLDLNDLAYETQMAYLIYSYLPERWEGMSGTYMGKDLNMLPYWFEFYELNKPEQEYCLDAIRVIDREVAEDISTKQKAAQRAASRSKGI